MVGGSVQIPGAAILSAVGACDALVVGPGMCEELAALDLGVLLSIVTALANPNCVPITRVVSPWPSHMWRAICFGTGMAPMFIATAGWSIPRELAGLAATEGSGLQRYASILGATEINSTFWRRHQPKTFERWRNSVPARFQFAVKVPRSITHEAALAAPRSDLAAFFDDVRGLGEKLGPVLVQLPASVHFSTRRVSAFFRTMRALYSGPIACEPRHISWYGARASEIFDEYSVARVIADPPRPEEARMPNSVSSLRYIRYHGSPQVYRSSYDDGRLTALADFIRGERAGTTVWCVFDNTASGAALGDACRLSGVLGPTKSPSSKTAKPDRMPAI